MVPRDLAFLRMVSIAYTIQPFDTPLTLFYDAKRAQDGRLVVSKRAVRVLLPKTRMLSIQHLIIIFVIALIVFGPEKLPELARNLGKVMAEFKRATADFRSTFEDHLRDLEREASERKIVGGKAIGAAPSTAAAVTQAAADGANSQGPEAAPLSPAPGAVPAEAPYLSRSVGAPIAESSTAEPQEMQVEKTESGAKAVSDGRKRPS